MQASEANNETPLQKRKRLFTIFAIAVSAIAVIFYIYWALIGSKHITTNNAYTEANIAQVTSAVGGTVKAINVIDTQKVKAGDILVTLDDVDAMVVLKEAEANVARSESDLVRTQATYQRTQKLATSGYLSPEALSAAESAFKSAKANLDLANATLTKAQVDLNRVIIRAPIDGIVAKREIQLGQSINTRTYLLSIIPTDQIYVDANFKEVQLQKVKIGQPVLLRADIYGSSVTYHGRVAGISGGTGSLFAIIPAQNATGNWIKVVQRLPVRIEIDPKDLARHPLQVGLSMNVDIYTGKNHA